MEGIVGWIVASIFGGIGAASLLPLLVKGSVRWPVTQWVLLVVLGGAGAVILSVSLFRAARHVRLTTSSGRVSEGRVVDQRKEYVTVTHHRRVRNDDSLFTDTGSSSWIRYFPVVEFRSEQGQQVHFEGRVYGTSKPMIATGATVKVYYDPGHPSDAFIGTFSESWLKPLVMSVAGLVLLVSGLVGFVSSRRALAADLAAARSPEAYERQIQDDTLASYNYPIHLKGTIDRVQRLDGHGPALFEFICKATRPGGSAPEEFRTVSFPFDPGSGVLGRAVEIYFNPEEPAAYHVPLGALLKELAGRLK